MDNALLREDGYRRTRSTPVAGAGFIRIGLGDGLCHVGAKAIVMPARELEVCATIGLNGRPIATEAILDLVWPDSETARARTCLKVHVHRIRARLGRRSALFCSGERWSLGPDVTLDLWEWERTANQAGRVPSTEPQRNALFATFDALLAGPAPSLARSAIAVDPYRERWHEALIRAQVDQGDLFAARSSLRSYQATLQAELGEPLPKAIESLLSKGASAV